MTTSRNEPARQAWDRLIAAIINATEKEGDMSSVAQLSMTREQADILFPLAVMLAGVAGEVRVIREAQSSKSQLHKNVRRIK